MLLRHSCGCDDWDEAFRVLRLVNGSGTFEIDSFVFLFSCVYSLMCDLLWRSHNEVHDVEALLRTASGHCNLANSSQWKIRLQRQGGKEQAWTTSSIVRSKGRIWCFWFDKTFAVGAVWSCVPRIPKISQDSLLILLWFDNFNTLFNVS